jgi:hypothetical protein
LRFPSFSWLEDIAPGIRRLGRHPHRVESWRSNSHAMDDTYCRSRRLSTASDNDTDRLPARLHKHVMANPGVDKGDSSLDLDAPRIIAVFAGAFPC